MMKTFLVQVVAILFFTLSAGAQGLNLTGTWTAQQKNAALTSIFFGENNSFIMVMDNDTFGGKNFTHNGKVATLTYKVNFTVKPARLDLIITESERDRKTITRGLLMIINPNVIKVALNFSDGERPKDFSVSNSVFFKREKN